jgi:hypothetical protein
MPVQERLMAAGQWSLQLDPSTPKSVRDILAFFGHIFVFDTPMRPGLADATMIATSRWGGILRRHGPTPWDFSGVNMIAWLGDEDGKGPILETAVTGAGSGFAGFVTSILAQCPAVTIGTATAVGGVFSNTYQWITARAALDDLRVFFSAEYRVNKNATLDYAPIGSAAMFKVTPTAVAMKRSSGRDLSVSGLSVTQLDVSIDAELYVVRVELVDATGAHTPAGVVTTYKDLNGNLIKMTQVVNSPLTPNASAATVATGQLTALNVLRNQITLTSDEYDIDRDVAVGDNLYVYDVDGTMVDTTNQVRYRGSLIFPITVRVLSITWPIERGMGVWYRDLNGVWSDLTNYVLFEAPGVTFEVGAAALPLTKS